MVRLESAVCHVAVLRRALVARAAGSWCMARKHVARVRIRTSSRSAPERQHRARLSSSGFAAFGGCDSADDGLVVVIVGAGRTATGIGPITPPALAFRSLQVEG